MERGARNNIAYGQVCLYVGLLIAVLIRPHGLSTNDGISYYGTFRNTVFPYALGLLGSAYFSLKAAERIIDTKLSTVKISLNAIAALTVIIVITPYSAGAVMDWLHTTAGSILFIIQLLLSGWLVKKLHYDVWVTTFSLVELAAGIACAFYLRPSQGLLLQGQVVFQMAFGIVLLRGLSRFNLNKKVAPAQQGS